MLCLDLLDGKGHVSLLAEFWAGSVETQARVSTVEHSTE